MAVWAFADFELDSAAFELREGGRPVRLEKSPLGLLILLAENQGQLVTRDRIVQALWGDEVFVETDLGINTAIRKIRQALHDDPAAPRFLHTVVGKGYRFVTPPEALREAAAAGVASATALPGAARAPRARTTLWLALAGLVLVAGVAYAVNRTRSAGAERVYRSVAVLPMANLSGDPGQDYFADGMTDALITELAKIGGLQVVSRTSIVRYARTTRPVPEIAGELGVDAVVEGSVVRDGEDVRITAQLIDAATDRHIWAKDYETALQGVIALQGFVARDIAGELRVRLTKEEKDRLGSGHSASPEAMEAYVRGRSAFELWKPEGTALAREYFQKAIALDPSYAEAHAAMAETYVFGPEYVLPTRENATPARQFAERALQLDPLLGAPHAALAQVDFVEWNWKSAGEGFARAVELSPNNPSIRHLYSHFLTASGRLPESFEHATRMLQLEPLAATSFNHLAYHHLKAEEYDRALAAADRALRIQPNYTAALYHRVLAHVGRRAYPHAFADLVQLFRLGGRPEEEIRSRELAFRRGGWRGFIEDDVRRMVAVQRAEAAAGKPYDYGLAWEMAENYAMLGRHDEAFAVVEKCFAARSSLMLTLHEDQLLAPLRSDPRFADLERRVGIPVPYR